MTEDEQKVLLLALAVERDRLRAQRDDLADALRAIDQESRNPAGPHLTRIIGFARAALDRQEQP